MDSQTFAIPGDQYGYTGIPIDQIETNNVTLAACGFDESGSTTSFSDIMEKAVQTNVRSLRFCKNSDSLMLRQLHFGTNLREVHGWKPLSQCHEDDYKNCYQSGGQTNLFGAVKNIIESIVSYADQQAALHYNVNAILTIMTDGEHYLPGGKNKKEDVKLAMESAVASESLESIRGILIGVNDSPAIQANLKDLATYWGFQYIAINDANEKQLAKMADFISRSIQATSQALGSGGVSQSLTF